MEMTGSRINGIQFREMVCGGAQDLRANAEIVNNLNVFPIPDGDTGDNMSMTIEGGVTASAGEVSESLATQSDKIAHGMLLGARGNSGVILSQLFAGIAMGFADMEEADVRAVGEAFRSGVRRAYGAVGTPVEGTILTVAREATEYACDRITAESTIESFFSDFARELRLSLDRTPDLLAVLREAGVVDSGGAGLVYVIEGMLRVLRGQPAATPASATQASGKAPIDTSAFGQDSVMVYGYCTEFLLQLQTCKVDPDTFDIAVITDYLETVGDSIVAVKSGSVVKIHVHTLIPGEVLSHCQQYGEFLTLKIENMTLQHTEAVVRNDFSDKHASKNQHKAYAVVAVASGKGITETFKSLGADVIVDGGQTNNPSAEDFLYAFDSLDADTIIVMPNNGNIRMAAEQAASLYEKADVRVLETASIGDGYAALTMLDFTSGDTDQIMQNLRDAICGVQTGLVSRAVRDAHMNGIDVRANDYIGFCQKTMLASDPDKNAAALRLCEKMELGAHDILILIAGADCTLPEAEALHKAIKEKFPSVEIYRIDGGQEVYDYILIAE